MSQTPPPPGNVPPGNYPPGNYSNYGPPQPLSPEDEKLWSTLTHIGGIFFSFVAPLITYLVFKDRGPFVRAHTATALNFQLTMVIAYIVSIVLWFFVIGILMSIAVAVVVIVFSIIAAVAANKGQFYKYPLSIQFVS